MSNSDLGKNALGAEVVEARNGPYDLGGLTKGVEIGLHLLVDPRDRRIEGVDLLKMELKQEAVVSGGWPRKASRSSSCVALIRWSAEPAKTAGSVWPAIIASIMRRPLTPGCRR